MTSKAYERRRMDGRVTIVTGGGSGIGRATARLLAARLLSDAASYITGASVMADGGFTA